VTATAYSWHAEAWLLVQSALKHGAHALLLAGARGLGKRELALQLAAAYLCDAGHLADAPACGVCESCRWLAAGTHPDFSLVEPIADETNAEQGSGSAPPGRTKPINVDQIRQLSDLLGISAHRSAG
jgi:DNA polymerase III subunit delta'